MGGMSGVGGGLNLSDPNGMGPQYASTGGKNPLDQFIYSLGNLTAGQGQGILGQGLNVFGQGSPLVNTGEGLAQGAFGTVGSGLRTTAGGLQTTGSGLAAAAPALDYLTKLVRGDQADVAEAAAPQIDEIGQQFDQIRNLVSLQPRGGGKASVLAESPFEKTKAIQGVEGQMRSGAAGQLGALSNQIAQTGLGESGVGLGVGQLGLGAGQLGLGIGQLGLGQESAGLGLAGLGSGLESMAIQEALGKEGLNYSQPSALSQALSGFSTTANLLNAIG